MEYTDPTIRHLFHFPLIVYIKINTVEANQAFLGSEPQVTFICLGGAPTPNPCTWESVPSATGKTTIELAATTATHPLGVEYYFEIEWQGISGTETDASDWVETAFWTWTDLVPGIEYPPEAVVYV